MKHVPYFHRPGAILAIIAVVALVIALGCATVSNLLKDRRDQNERAALQTVRSLNTALYQHRQAHPDMYPKSLGEVDGVEAALKCGASECLKSGYRFKYELLPATNMGPRYAIQVRPNKYENTGVQSFYSDESGVIRATKENRPAGAGDGPVS